MKSIYLRKRASLVFVAVLSLILLSACQGMPSPTSDPSEVYRAEIDIAMEEGSDWDRKVLADYRVTEVEMLESLDRYVSCIQEVGIEPYEGYGLDNLRPSVEFPLVGKDLESPDGLQLYAHLNKCQYEYIDATGYWFEALLYNPDNLRGQYEVDCCEYWCTKSQLVHLGYPHL